MSDNELDEQTELDEFNAILGMKYIPSPIPPEPLPNFTWKVETIKVPQNPSTLVEIW